MAIKSVFGFAEGNKNKQCTLVGEYSEGKLWIISNELNIALEKDGLLCRLGHVGDRDLVSEKHLKRYTDVAESGGLMAKLKDVCETDYTLALRRRSEMLMDEKSRPNNTYVNANFFKLCGMMHKYNTVVGINAEIKAHKEELDAAALRAQEVEADKQRLEYRTKLIAEVVADDYIDADDFVTLADEFEVKIPLRTRGWILNKLSDIKSNSLRWQPAKKSDRASDKVIPLYREVRAKVLESLGLVSDQKGA